MDSNGTSYTYIQCPICSLWYVFGTTHCCWQTAPIPAAAAPPAQPMVQLTLPPVARITLLEGGVLPEIMTGRSVGFDLAIAEDASIPPHKARIVRTGLIIQPPAGTWLMLAARSSLIKRGLVLANGIGVVDPDYCGPEDEIKLSLFNVMTDYVANVKAGDRLAQGMFLPLPGVFSWEQVNRAGLPESRGGFGSTGR